MTGLIPNLDHQFFALLNDGVLVVDSRGLILEASPVADRMFGYEPGQLVGSSIEVLVPAESRAAHERKRNAYSLAPTAREMGSELSLVAARADGTCFHADISLNPVARPAGLVTVAVVRNIDAQVQAEQARTESEDHYRLLAENASDVVWELDTDELMVWVSPSIEGMLGWRPEQVLGTHPVQLIHPEDREIANLRRALAYAGEPLDPVELRVRTADGDYRWMSPQARPTISADGSVSGVVVGMRDVHEQVLARQALAESEHLFRLAMSAAPGGMAIVGLDLAFREVNPALCAMLGRDEEWLLSHTLPQVIHPDDVDSDLAELDSLLNGTTLTAIHERRWLRPDGSSIWVMHSTALLRDGAHQPVLYVSQVLDNNDAHHAKELLAYAASHDSLTELPNRKKFQERLTSLLNHEPRRGGPAGLMFCDLDNFKHVNDTYGHAAGDEVLRTTAKRAAAVLRTDDIIARLGGDEFVVALTTIHNMAAALQVAEKLRAAVRAPVLIGEDQVTITITISIGVAIAGPDSDADRLLSDADAALYEAKNAGRDRIAMFADGQIRVVEPQTPIRRRYLGREIGI